MIPLFSVMSSKFSMSTCTFTCLYPLSHTVILIEGIIVSYLIINMIIYKLSKKLYQVISHRAECTEHWGVNESGRATLSDYFETFQSYMGLYWWATHHGFIGRSPELSPLPASIFHSRNKSLDLTWQSFLFTFAWHLLVSISIIWSFQLCAPCSHEDA